MNCKTCGAPLREGARFCARCGAQVPLPGTEESAAAPQQARSPFEPAQRTADRVFPSQQRSAPQQPYAPAQQSYPPAQSAGIDWERLQPRTSPKSANALIWGAAAVVFAVLVMVWTLLIH